MSIYIQYSGNIDLAHQEIINEGILFHYTLLTTCKLLGVKGSTTGEVTIMACLGYCLHSVKVGS